MKTIEVVAVVIRDGDKILVTRRDYGNPENMWEFPRRKIEAGETRETALIREINELTWVPADIIVVEKIKGL